MGWLLSCSGGLRRYDKILFEYDDPSTKMLCSVFCRSGCGVQPDAYDVGEGILPASLTSGSEEEPDLRIIAFFKTTLDRHFASLLARTSFFWWVGYRDDEVGRGYVTPIHPTKMFRQVEVM